MDFYIMYVHTVCNGCYAYELNIVHLCSLCKIMHIVTVLQAMRQSLTVTMVKSPGISYQCYSIQPQRTQTQSFCRKKAGLSNACSLCFKGQVASFKECLGTCCYKQDHEITNYCYNTDALFKQSLTQCTNKSTTSVRGKGKGRRQ